ncbi:MAG: hypothetical protein DRN64_02345, partial [Thaumarchaeota archaeon]
KLYRGGRIKREFYGDIKESRRKLICLFVVSISLLLISSNLLVRATIQLAENLALTTTFLGMTLTSIGTTLPELSVQLRAIKNKEYGLAMGDLLGSCVVNLSLILGLLSVVSPMKVETSPLLTLLPFLFIAIFVVWYAISYKKKITRFEGTILIFLYILFILEAFRVI